ncbi:hypothetical protein [Streptomyces sp. NPDC055506]
MKEHHREMDDGMPGHSCVGNEALLDRPIQPAEPQYPVAEEALGALISCYSYRIREEQEKPHPNESAIKQYAEERARYDAEMGRLSNLAGAELTKAAARYQEAIKQMWPLIHGKPESGCTP